MSPFHDAAPAAPAPLTLVLQFDGGSRGNPGPAGIGVTLTADDGTALYELGAFIGRATNNVAEYTALIRGLEAALAMGAAKVIVRADSELVIRQMTGMYRVKNARLLPLYQQATALVAQLPACTFSHTYREGNTRPDALANLAMDKKATVEPLGPLPRLRRPA